MTQRAEDIEKKIAAEKKVMHKMIELYCSSNHGGRKHELCSDCSDLAVYAFARIDSCPIKEEKTFCSSCAIHCYKPEMREQIRTVMRFSGPRMLLHHPILALKHTRTNLQEKKSARANQSSTDLQEGSPKAPR